MLSLQQVARTWWTDTRWGRSRAKAAMTELETLGWLQIHSSLTRPIDELQEPLMRWSPGDDRPDFWRLSRVLHKRSMQAASMTKFVFASPKSIVLFGRGRAPSVKLTHMTFEHVFESQPMSLSSLRGMGALEESTEGLKWLARVGGHRKLSGPRWGVYSQPGNWSDDDKKLLKEAQQLLRELGPTLVKDGRLSP